MTRLDQVRERYLNDAHFHGYVDMMRKAIVDLHLTPSELREAAMLAALIEEENRGCPKFEPVNLGPPIPPHIPEGPFR